jgi:RHS repeat-associated protein
MLRESSQLISQCFEEFCLKLRLRGKAPMAMKKRFYHANGQMMAYEEGGVTKDFLTDHLGSITAEIDQNQNRTFETRYSAFGRNNWSTGAGCGFGWVGSYGYRETGLFHSSHYVRARHYSHLTGGWSTVDPLWPDESAYGYVGGRSAAQIDPSGRGHGETILKGCKLLSPPERPCCVCVGLATGSTETIPDNSLRHCTWACKLAKCSGVCGGVDNILLMLGLKEGKDLMREAIKAKLRDINNGAPFWWPAPPVPEDQVEDSACDLINNTTGVTLGGGFGGPPVPDCLAACKALKAKGRLA